MLDQSMEELREYVNNCRLNKSHTKQSENGATEHFSQDELIKILESDTLNMDDLNGEAQHSKEKTLENGDNCSNVLQVDVDNVAGLTLEIRESFVLKLTSALTVNYKTVNKQNSTIFTESNISGIAKKMEYGILSTATDLSSYKLSVANTVVNIERQTLNRKLYEILLNEIELLKLRGKMQTADANEQSQQLPSTPAPETESLLCKKSQFQNGQSITESTTAHNESANPLDLQNSLVSESEYFSCSPGDNNSLGNQQINDISIKDSNTKESIMNVLQERNFRGIGVTIDEALRSIPTDEQIFLCNNNFIIKVDSSDPTGPSDASNKITSSEEISDVNKSLKNFKLQNINTQDPDDNVPEEEQSEHVETAANGKILSISQNDNIPICIENHVEKILPELSNLLSDTLSSYDNFDPVSVQKILPNKKRKRKTERDLEIPADCPPASLTDDNAENLNKKQKNMESEKTLETSEVTTGANNIETCESLTNSNAENLNIKQKHMESEKALETSETTTSANDNVQTCEFQLQDSSQKSLDKNRNVVKKSDETLQIASIKREQENIKIEPMSPSAIYSSCNHYSTKRIPLENDSTDETALKKYDELSNSEKTGSLVDKHSSQDRTIKVEIASSTKDLESNRTTRCRIKAEFDLSQFSTRIKNKENINEEFWDKHTIKNENLKLSDEILSNVLKYNATLQTSGIDFENDTASSLGTSIHNKKNTEVMEVEESSALVVDVNIGSKKSNILRESNCLIDERAFDLERARLDKLCEELKKNRDESSVDIIHSDYQKIFKIIIPIIRKYYPSEFIPDELCYGHILQRLQIDLMHADMCDDDMAFYIKDSIKTRRYLLDNCIVQ